MIIKQKIIHVLSVIIFSSVVIMMLLPSLVVANAQQLPPFPSTLQSVKSAASQNHYKQEIDSCMPYSQHMNSNFTWTTVNRHIMTQSCHGILARLTEQCNPLSSFNTSPFPIPEELKLKGTPICNNPNLVDWEQRYFNPATDTNLFDFPIDITPNNNIR